MLATDIGIDLGTDSVLVYIKGTGIVLKEPSVVAYDRDTNEIKSIGEEAREMIGRTPGNIAAVCPLRQGVISDYTITEKMLKYFIHKAVGRKTFWRPRITVCVPSGVTEVEKRAVKDSAKRAGARQVELVEEPMAAAIGVGLPVTEPAASMIVDIGGGTTEVAVISLTGIVAAKSVRVGGDELDLAIIQHMKRVYNLMVGERTSERIKIEIGSAYPVRDQQTLEVRGRDLVSGMPKTVRISAEEIRVALQEPITTIIEAVRSTLERCPPELSADLIERGIMLAGGGAMLCGLDQLLTEETGLPVFVAEEPLNAVANGAGIILQEMVDRNML